MKLNSTDVFDPPTVDTNLIALQEELERMVMCVEREREFQDQLRELGFNITEVMPGTNLDMPLIDVVRTPSATPHATTTQCPFIGEPGTQLGRCEGVEGSGEAFFMYTSSLYVLHAVGNTSMVQPIHSSCQLVAACGNEMLVSGRAVGVHVMMHE